MKAQDLRLGNFVIAKNEIIKIIEFRESFVLGENDNSLIRCLPSQMKPIELTEIMLIHLFGKSRTNGNKFDIYNIPTSGFEIQDRRKSALPTPTICIVRFGVHICNIKYLHELQNILYYLTKQELKINL
jgi:hypothetical protein